MNTNAEQKTYHITAIESSKGGVGKTTSTAMIAQILAISGQRVLIVDMDFQSKLYRYDVEELLNKFQKYQ